MGSRWLTRFAVTAAAAGALTLAAATSAMATDGSVDINSDHVPTTAADFKTHECDGPLSGLPVGIDGWHFVLPQATGDSFTSLALEFTAPGGPVTAKIESRDPAAPSKAGDWSGYIGKTGPKNNGDGKYKHAYVFTPSGWTLTGGTAVVDVAAVAKSTKAFFNLSHTCVGDGASPSNPGPSNPEPSDSGPSNPGGSSTPPGGDGGGLPITGPAVGSAVVVGLALIVGGVVLTALRRRRNLFEATEL